jgi:hypothetical protein
MKAGVVPLQLCFKGARNYLQGGDLCQAIMQAADTLPLGGVVRFQLAFHRFIARQPDLVWLDPEDPAARATDAPTAFTVSGAGGLVRGQLVESGRAVDCRIPFDEDSIVRHCDISGDVISIGAESGYLPAEVLVSMTKHLHNSLLPAPAGRWIFTRLDVTRLFTDGDATGMSVTLGENLHGRLTKSAIRVRGQPLGHIYFSMVNR